MIVLAIIFGFGIAVLLTTLAYAFYEIGYRAALDAEFKRKMKELMPPARTPGSRRKLFDIVSEKVR